MTLVDHTTPTNTPSSDDADNVKGLEIPAKAPKSPIIRPDTTPKTKPPTRDRHKTSQ